MWPEGFPAHAEEARRVTKQDIGLFNLLVDPRLQIENLPVLGFALLKKKALRRMLIMRRLNGLRLKRMTQTDLIFGWSASLVKESLRNHAKGRNLARAIYHYPLTLVAIVGWFFDIGMVPILHWMEEQEILWSGKFGRGKTNVISILSMPWPRFLLAWPSISIL